MQEVNFKDLEEKLQSYFATCRKEGERYPDFFGGSKTDDQNGITLYLVDAQEDVKDHIKAIIPEVSFENAAVSKNTLHRLYEKMNEQYRRKEIKKRCDELQLSSFCIDDAHGTILIGVQNLTKVKQKAVKDMFDFVPYLAFEEESMVEEQANPGDIRTRVDLHHISSGTIGFPAIDQNNTRGFITTTHNGGAIGDPICDYLSNQIGTIEQLQYGGKVDATFVRSTPAGNITNTTSYSNKRILLPFKFSCLKPTLTMDGAGSQVCTTGKILSHDSTTHQGITNCYRCEYDSTRGDSGAPVTWGNFLIAMHISASHNGHKNRAHCCKYQNIRNALGIHLE